jgi:serine protease Do
LGVQIQDVTRELAESFGMKKPQGALVSRVVPGSPAEKAELQIGDIITEFNGQAIDSSSDLPPRVGMTPVNEKATLKIIRQGEVKTITFKIGLLPDQPEQLAEAKVDVKPSNRIGVSVVEISDEQREALQMPRGGVIVQDVAPGSAKDAGIQRGDVILRIQNQVIEDVEGFEKVVKNLPVGKSIAVLIQRRGSPAFLALKIDK